MIVKLITICALLVQSHSQQLPITFQDGKIGVNFGGYHAEAGLGGLLTGNAAHGGLTASAGTPYGQTAHAGLGGNTGSNSRGGLFAGASAGNGVGASASLAGDLNNPAGGSLGIGQAEAHAGGIQKEVIKTVSTNVESNVESNVGTVDVAPVVVEPSALPPHSDETVVAQSEQAVEIPSQPEYTEQNQAEVVESQQSNIPIQTEQIEQSTQSVVVQSTQSVVVQSTSTSATETTVASAPYAPAQVASSSSFDADDNDLTDNKVPQVATVPQTVTQVVSQQPAAVNVQKIKVRPQPVQIQPTYTVVQKQVQVPVIQKTYSYQQPIVQPVPVKQVVQYSIPVYHKRIQITASAPYPQVVQHVEAVETTPGPTTTTTSTTPRPPYVYTYDKNQVINEILSIPFHALRAASEIINAKLAGGYSIQKTVSYV